MHCFQKEEEEQINHNDMTHSFANHYRSYSTLLHASNYYMTPSLIPTNYYLNASRANSNYESTLSNTSTDSRRRLKEKSSANYYNAAPMPVSNQYHEIAEIERPLTPFAESVELKSTNNSKIIPEITINGMKHKINGKEAVQEIYFHFENNVLKFKIA